METPEAPSSPPPGGILQRWILRVLRGSHHHYLSMLPDRLGRLRSRALRLFFSGVRLEPHQAAVLRELPAEGIVVYATRFRCAFSLLFAYCRFSQMGLPYPRISLGCRFGIWQPVSHLLRGVLAQVHSLVSDGHRLDPFANGFFRDALLQGSAGFLPLIARRGLWRRLLDRSPDPVAFLISLQRSTDRPVFLVPQIVFFSRKQRRAQPTMVDIFFGPEDEPGRLRLLTAVFKNPGNVFVEVSTPVNVQRFLEREDIAGQSVEYQAALLRGEVLAQIDRHRQSIMGPVLKSQAELKERILDSERFQQFMQAHAESHQMSLTEVRAKAAGCLDEIAADQRPNWIRFYSVIDGWILRTLFEGIAMNTEGFAAVKRASTRCPVVYIPSHKSHVDYLILSYMLYHNDLPCPLVAAGKNLSFWPMGTLFRRGGAFFIRRSFRGAALYSRVFAEYVHQILEEGYTIEQFIEGGRSRTGKLLRPKLGLLSMLLTAQKNGACEDLIFVPVSIGYDRVLEEKSYLHEIDGGQKKTENVWQVVRARKFLKRRHGKVYLQFSEPLSVNALAERWGTPLKDMGGKEFTRFSRALGNRIIHAIGRVGVVTPHAITAAAILNSGRERLDFQELMTTVEIYLNHLYAVGARLADTLIMDHHRAIARSMESYVQRKIIDAPEKDSGAPVGSCGYLLKETRRPFLEFYRNTCIAFFVPAAFTSLAVLQKDAFQLPAADLHADYVFLQELFQLEFVFDPDTPPEHHLHRSLALFVEDAVLIPHPSLPDTFNVTAAGFRKLKLFAMFLKTLLESYWVVLSYLRQAPAEGEDAKERVRRITSFGNRMFRQKEIDHREALSKVTYENALEFFSGRGITGAGDRDPIDAFARNLQQALRCLKP